jgi:hypothetical protein
MSFKTQSKSDNSSTDDLSQVSIQSITITPSESRSRPVLGASSLRERLRRPAFRGERNRSLSSSTAEANATESSGRGNSSHRLNTSTDTDPALELLLAITGCLSLGFIILLVNFFICRII